MFRRLRIESNARSVALICGQGLKVDQNDGDIRWSCEFRRKIVADEFAASPRGLLGEFCDIGFEVSELSDVERVADAKGQHGQLPQVN